MSKGLNPDLLGIYQKKLNKWLEAKQYVEQIKPNFKGRSWTKKELNQFVEEDKIT